MSMAVRVPPRRSNAGVTLIEAMVVVVILAIMAAVALPSFRDVRRDAFMGSVAGELVASLAEARSFAVANRSVTALIKGQGAAADNVDVGGDDVWVAGWRMVTGPGLASLLSRRTLSGGNGVNVLVADSAGTELDALAFNGSGNLVQADGSILAGVVITICDPSRNSERGRVVSINRLGRIRTEVQSNPEC